MKKKSYFEVSSVVNRWLTVGLVLVIVSLMLSQWSSTFTAASDAIAGSFGKALNTFMRTAVGNGVVSVLFGVGHVLLLEFFSSRDAPFWRSFLGACRFVGGARRRIIVGYCCSWAGHIVRLCSQPDGVGQFP